MPRHATCNTHPSLGPSRNTPHHASCDDGARACVPAQAVPCWRLRHAARRLACTPSAAHAHARAKVREVPRVDGAVSDGGELRQGAVAPFHARCVFRVALDVATCDHCGTQTARNGRRCTGDTCSGSMPRVGAQQTLALSASEPRFLTSLPFLSLNSTALRIPSHPIPSDRTLRKACTHAHSLTLVLS